MSDSITDTILVPLLLTDQPDYAPGSTVAVSMSGLLSGETVMFSVDVLSAGADGVYGTLDDVWVPGPAGVLTWSAPAAADGSLDTSWLVDPAYAGARIELNAIVLAPDGTSTGQMAAVTFTDSVPPPVPVTSPEANLSTLAVGDSVTFAAALGGTGIIGVGGDFGSGSGNFPSFLRVQATGQETSEQGFNTNATPLPLDDVGNGDNPLTHAILLSDVAVVNVGGVDYRAFKLDIAQAGSQPYLSLDKLQFYQSDNASIANLSDLQNPG